MHGDEENSVTHFATGYRSCHSFQVGLGEDVEICNFHLFRCPNLCSSAKSCFLRSPFSPPSPWGPVSLQKPLWDCSLGTFSEIHPVHLAHGDLKGAQLGGHGRGHGKNNLIDNFEIQ